MLHMAHAYRVGGGRELPILTDGSHVVIGSSAIVDYVNARHDEPRLIPPDPALAAEVHIRAQWADQLLAPVGS